jgi:hypothetical protein
MIWVSTTFPEAGTTMATAMRGVLVPQRTVLSHHRVVPRRTAVPGAELDILALAVGRRACVGVDLASGAFVRCHQPADPSGATLAPFDVGRGRISERDHSVAAVAHEQPESVVLDAPLERVGALRVRRAERYLRPLLHPRNRPILGLPAPAAPFWTLGGDRPSVALVEPERPPVVVLSERGMRCWFPWQGRLLDLPLDERRLLGRLEWTTGSRLAGPYLTHLLGYTPARVVVALSHPVEGHCYKVAAGFLPRP